MGAQQSTRKLTIDNDDPVNVIKVSDAVVDRLKGSTEASLQNTNAAVKDPSPTPNRAIPVTPKAESTPPPSPTTGEIPALQDLRNQQKYKFETSKTSAKRIINSETASKKYDAYWQNRINKLEETHDKINKLMEEEYNSAMNEVNSEFNYVRIQPRPTICAEGKKAIVDCYKKHPNQPMRCAKLVQDFAECVDKHRETIVLADNRKK